MGWSCLVDFPPLLPLLVTAREFVCRYSAPVQLVYLGTAAALLHLVSPASHPSCHPAHPAGHSPTTLRLFHAVREQPWRLWATLHVLRLIQVCLG